MDIHVTKQRRLGERLQEAVNADVEASGQLRDYDRKMRESHIPQSYDENGVIIDAARDSIVRRQQLAEDNIARLNAETVRINTENAGLIRLWRDVVSYAEGMSDKAIDIVEPVLSEKDKGNLAALVSKLETALVANDKSIREINGALFPKQEAARLIDAYIDARAREAGVTIADAAESLGSPKLFFDGVTQVRPEHIENLICYLLKDQVRARLLSDLDNFYDGEEGISYADRAALLEKRAAERLITERTLAVAFEAMSQIGSIVSYNHISAKAFLGIE